MEDSPLEKLKSLPNTEILVELFGLLQDVKNSNLHSKDFHNSVGPLRIKIQELKEYLKDLDGICDSPEKQEKQINDLQENKSTRMKFLKEFETQCKERCG